MQDRFDLALLNLVQQDDSRTAEQLAEQVPLSPSAIARRLRRLRAEGWIDRTIALLSRRLTDRRLRAIVAVQLSEHADLAGKSALLGRIRDAHQVQFCYELTGDDDLLMLVDCSDMAQFNGLAAELLERDPTVHRYRSNIIKGEPKFAPFVQLDG